MIILHDFSIRIPNDLILFLVQNVINNVLQLLYIIMLIVIFVILYYVEQSWKLSVQYSANPHKCHSEIFTFEMIH